MRPTKEERQKAVRELRAAAAIYNAKADELSRRLTELLVEYQPAVEAFEAAWRATSRWMVRGHWRAQACGRGRAERRPTWIAPYWKGPADGTGVAKMYEVGSPIS